MPMIPQAISFYEYHGIFYFLGTCNTCDLRLSYWLRLFFSLPKINAQRGHKNINCCYDCQDNLTPHHFPFRKSRFPPVFAWNFPITPCKTSSIIHITIDNIINNIPIPQIFHAVAALSLRPGFPGASSE
jgi:hypothetical protein